MVWPWRIPKLNSKLGFQRLSTGITGRRQHIENNNDEGDWSYSSEWWGSDSDHRSHSIYGATSLHGNGTVSVLAYPSSTPNATCWPRTENWLRQRCLKICPDSQYDHLFKILGYQWRVLRFNGDTRQSAAKVMVASKMSDPQSLYYMQQGHCLAIPYTKSMISAGLTALSCNYDLLKAIHGKRKLRVLCVGHGGGSLPLFLATKIQGAVVDIVEIDPLVISASIHAMGFPSFSIATPSGLHALPKPTTIDEVFWKGVHERLFLYESDAENFILDTENQYDIAFIDAYNGDDIFPSKLWDPNSRFLKALANRLHPHHGTAVVNLHSDGDLTSHDGSMVSDFQRIRPMGKYVSRVCQAYKDTLVSCEKQTGSGFVVSVPWVCNSTLVVCRGFNMSDGVLDQDSILTTLVSKSVEVDIGLDSPFSSSEYLKRGFTILD